VPEDEGGGAGQRVHVVDVARHDRQDLSQPISGQRTATDLVRVDSMVDNKLSRGRGSRRCAGSVLWEMGDISMC
jgi:hypothetical protein